MQPLPFCLACQGILCAAAFGAVNLVPNPGLEPGAKAAFAEGWSSLVLGAPATFTSDAQVRHGGKASVRIDAAEITRAYAQSAPIAVVPGERLRISAWVKVRGVPADRGTVIAIAAFSRGDSRADVLKVDVARASVEDWQRLEGSVTVPPGNDTLRLRLGFSYSMGTVWWDDVVVEPDAPLVARLELPDDRLCPSAATKVTLLNRAGRKGRVEVRVTMSGRVFQTIATLTGEPSQTANVPIDVGAPGRRTLKVELCEEGQGKPFFSLADIRATVPAPVMLNPLIPTHWAVEDGEPQIDGELDLALSEEQAKGASVSVQLVDADGKVLVEKAIDDFRPVAVTAFSMRAAALPEGTYRVVAAVRPAAGPRLTSEQTFGVLRRAAAKTTLNRDGYPEQNGRAIFPLGMFNNVGRIAESAAAGFNVTHAYNAARVQPGRRPDDQRLKNVLDATEKAGMRCQLLVPIEYAFVGQWDAFARRIRMFRNHPGLLMWNEEEGIARGDMNLDALKKMRALLREIDPHHPFMVGDSCDVIGRVADRGRMFPADLMDMGMWWWYPLPLKIGGGDELAGEPATSRPELVPPAFLTRASTDKPIWVGVQAYKKPGADGRYPTPEEYRAQAYIAVIHGAKGLMWYGGSVTGGMFLAPEEGHWDDLKKLVGELKEMSPVFMGPAEPPPTVAPEDAPISAAVRRAPDARFLLAANRGLEPCEVTIALPGVRDGAAPVRFEQRTVTIDRGAIRDRFAPLAVHVYQLPE